VGRRTQIEPDRPGSAWKGKSGPATKPKVDDRLTNLGWGRQQHGSKSVH